MIPDTISDAELAASLDRPVKWVRRQVSERGLAHTRVGRWIRFTPDEAAAFVAAFHVPAAMAAPAPDPLRSQTSRSRARSRA